MTDPRQRPEPEQAIASVTALVHAEAAAIDDADWDLLGSVLADEVEIDYDSWRPGTVGRHRREAWVARVAGMRSRLVRTRHAVSNVWVVVDGTSATVRADLRADHVRDPRRDDPPVFVVNGVYRNRYEWTPATGWRLARKQLDVHWTEGDRSIVDAGRHD